MRVPTRKPDKYLRGRPDPRMTRAKAEELEAEAEKMKRIRPRLAEEVKRLATDGDFSENAAYQIAKGRLRGLNQRLLEIEDLLSRAEIIETSGGRDTVQLGNSVTVEVGGKTKTYQILGSTETDPSAGIISSHSPLGTALLNRRLGDIVSVPASGRKIEYKIIGIE